MTLQQLRYFCVTAKILHYTKAAETLYVSQPSLSHALSELEKELGVRLFERSGKQTLLTKYGEAFLPYAQNALDELSRGTGELERMLMPTIDLGYLNSISVEFIPAVIDAFYACQGSRNIAINFVPGGTAGMIQKLKSNQLDLIFTPEATDHTVKVMPVFEQELYLVVPEDHLLARDNIVSIDSFRNEKIITINPHYYLRQQILDYFHSQGVEPKIIFAVDDCAAMATYVSSKMGVAVMPLVPSLSSLNVKILRIQDPPTRTIYLVCSKNRQLQPAVKTFRDFVINIYAKDQKGSQISG